MLQKLKTLLKAEIDPAFAKRAEYVFSEIEKHKAKKILDIGCGRGFYVQALSMCDFPEEIHGIDLNDKYLAIVRKKVKDKRVKIAKKDICHLTFPPNYFDCIIMSEVLEHLIDEKRALQNLKKILNKNGKLIITVPNQNFPFFWDPLNWLLMRIANTHVNKNIWWLAGMWADHEQLYTETRLKELAENSDFKVQNLRTFIAYSWPLSHFILYGIGKNIAERLRVKSVDRFSTNKKPLAEFLAAIFRFPQKFEGKLDKKSTVNIALVLTKS